MAWTNVNYLPLVNKARRPKFDVHLKIYDLNNVPLVHGVSFIKWHLPHSIHSEHRGRTAKCPIANHRVEYGYGKVIPVRIAIDKSNTLAECLAEFEVLQEFSANGGVAGRSETITLGKVTLNLSEYVDESANVVRETPFRTRGPSVASTNNNAAGDGAAAHHARKRSSLSTQTPVTPDDGVSPTTATLPSKPDANDTASNNAPSINEPAPAPAPAPDQNVEDGVIRRYLMQDSKINSTLKIGILMVQVDGERNFSAPPLKTAAVFGGIAGMVADSGGAGGSSSIPDPAAADFGHLHLQDDTQDSAGGNLGAHFSLGKNNGKTRDVYELQDMYRRSLAASWACQPGELPADECIEDIFAGGDGFGPDASPATSSAAGDATPRGHHSHHRSRHSLSRNDGRPGLRADDNAGTGDDDLLLRPSDRRGMGGGQRRHHARNGSGESGITVMSRVDPAGGPHQQAGRGHRRDGSKDSGRPPSSGGLRGRSVSLSSLAATIESERGRSGFKSAKELNEFDVREDMVAWKLPGTVA